MHTAPLLPHATHPRQLGSCAARIAICHPPLLSLHNQDNAQSYLLVQHDFPSVHPPGLLLANSFSSGHMAMTPGTSCYITFPGMEVRPTYLQLHTPSFSPFLKAVVTSAILQSSHTSPVGKSRKNVRELSLCQLPQHAHTYPFTAQALAGILSA